MLAVFCCLILSCFGAGNGSFTPPYLLPGQREIVGIICHLTDFMDKGYHCQGTVKNLTARDSQKKSKVKGKTF